MKKRIVRPFIFAVVIGSLAALGGCQTDKARNTETMTAAAAEFRGGGMQFAYQENTWRVSKADRYGGSAIVSLFNQDNEATISLAAYVRNEAREVDLFNEVRKMDAGAGIKDEKTDRKTEAGVKRHTLSYWVEDEDAAGNQRFVYAAVYRFKESQAIAVLAEYYHEEDRQGIEAILNTLADANITNTDEVLETLEKDQHLGEILDEFLYYYNGELEIQLAETLSNVDKTFYPKSGYDYIFDVEMAGYSGNVYTIAAPEAADYDGEYLYYYQHGVYLYLYTDSFQKKGESASDYLKRLVDYDLNYYREMPRDYTNIVENPMVSEQDTVYQVIQADYVSSDSSRSAETSIYFAKTLSSDDVLYWKVELSPYYFDADTYSMIQELFRAYGMPADVFYMEPPELTVGGNLVEQGQDQYENLGDEVEVEQMEAYPLIGSTILTEDEQEIRIYVPRGRYTSSWGYGVDFIMYGLTGDVRVWQNYYDLTNLEYAAEQINYIYDSHKDYSKYYKDMGEITEVSGLAGETAAVYFSEYEIEADNSQSLVYHIVLCKDLGNDYFQTTELQLDTQDVSKETVELLDQYGKVLGIDFYRLMDRESENPLNGF